MKKRTLLTTLVISLALTLPTATALSTSFDSPDSLSNNGELVMQPGETKQVEMQLNLEGNETEVALGAMDTGDYSFSYNPPFPPYEDDSQFVVDVTAPDKGNYSYNMTLNFDVTSDSNTSDNQTSSENVEVNLPAKTKIPYTELQSDTWINESYELDFNGQRYNVSSIENNLYLDNNSIKVDGTRTINDVRIQVKDTIPGEYAKIYADTKVDDATFSMKPIVTNVDKQASNKCKLGIKTITTLNRGSSFAIETINTESSDNRVVADAGVTLIDSGEGTPIGQDVSGSTGYVSIYIPEDTKGPVVARVTKPDSDCESNNQQVAFNKPYNVYIEDNEDFQLNMNVKNETTYGDIVATVTDKKGGDVGSGILRITKPDGTETDTNFNESGMVSYSPSTPGEYEIQATKDGYVSSETITVEYIADRDGDGVPNSQDECPDTEGIEENNGCPKKEVSIQVTGGEKGDAGALIKGTQYTLRVVDDETREVVNYTGEIDVRGSDKTIKLNNGVAEVSGVEGIRFNETGSYSLELNAPQFETVRETLSVENQKLVDFEEMPVIPVAAVLALVAGIIVYRRSDGFSSGGIDNDVSAGMKTELQPGPAGGDES